MDDHISNVIYLDRRAWEQRKWTRDDAPEDIHAQRQEGSGFAVFESNIPPGDEVDHNVRSLLSVFPHVNVHRTSTTCISEIEISRREASNSGCIIIIVNVPSDERPAARKLQRSDRSPSPSTSDTIDAGYSLSGDLYGMDFLIHLSYEIHTHQTGPRLVPIVMLSETMSVTSNPSKRNPGVHFNQPQAMQNGTQYSSFSRLRFFEAGAVDVLVSPISPDRAQSLPAHAYRISVERNHSEPRTRRPPITKRKTSWVGTKDDRPYTRSKDAMVSELMDHIVDPDRDSIPLDTTDFLPDKKRAGEIAEAFGSWHFNAHGFAEEELVYGCMLILDHTLTMPGLERYRMNQEQLTMFLIATRRVYNKSVLYHNFRHACDVLQASFYFLTQIGAIPPFPAGTLLPASHPTSPLGALVDPFSALVLLISAIGHDVGHPGVNNGFLVMVNAPLAQLYNDRSVLESFHCAAYSQILRRYWKATFEDAEIRRLMIQVITATDMGLHRDYMMQMDSLHGNYPEDAAEIDSWAPEKRVEVRELLMCLIIKCGDICNVARDFHTSSQWADLLMQEFAAQGQMERDLHLARSALFGGPPDPSSLLQKSNSQIGFMQVFGYPLFGGISKLLPGCHFTVEEIDRNRVMWQSNIDGEMSVQSKRNSKRFEDTGTAKSDDADGEEQRRDSHVDEAGSWPGKISLHFSASIASSRRASGGTPAQLFWGTIGPEMRRSSLGPTVIPESLGRKKRNSSRWRFATCEGLPKEGDQVTKASEQFSA